MRPTAVSLEIYNVLGHSSERLGSGYQAPGSNNFGWDGLDNHGISVPSRIHFYRLRADNYSETKKMLLLR
jgi:flagellar hook assembly protein FlgD